MGLLYISPYSLQLKPLVHHNAKPFTLGLCVRDFRLADTNMLVSKKPGSPKAKPARPNMSPNASWCNILCVGYVRVWFALAM